MIGTEQTEPTVAEVQQKFHALRVQITGACRAARDLMQAHPGVSPEDVRLTLKAAVELATSSSEAMLLLLTQLDIPECKELFEFEKSVKETGRAPATPKAAGKRKSDRKKARNAENPRV